MKTVLEECGFRKGFDFNNRFDLKTTVNNYLVSTVDLGIDHQYMAGLPPLYYETMICKIKDGEVDFTDVYCERYTTEEEARRGHNMAIDYVKNHLEALKYAKEEE